LSALTTPIAAPVVLISGEPDMPLTVSFGLDPKRAALMAGGDVGPGAVEQEQMRRQGDFDGRKRRRLVFKARKAHRGGGGGATSNGGSASTKASYWVSRRQADQEVVRRSTTFRRRRSRQRWRRSTEDCWRLKNCHPNCHPNVWDEL
jgi:hypothetical protein